MLALGAAIRYFAEDKEAVIAHEGFTVRTRDKLKAEIEGRGLAPRSQVIEVRKGTWNEPFIRLADSLSGLFGLMLFGRPEKADYFAGLFDERVNLEENESPPP